MKTVLTGVGLKQFLQSCHKQAPSASKIVLGNESGDLDSVVSSIVQSFYLSTRQNDQIVPILNFPKEDLSLRPETISVLSKEQCDLSSLTFIDEVNLLKASPKEIHLVDHNRLSHSQASLASLVVSVVDHHVDESNALVNAVDKKISTVGSACTLIAENILQNSQIDASIARLLLSPILSDTFNLSIDSGRTTEKDIQFANQLAKAIDGDKDVKEVQLEVFTEVEKAKYNTSSMSSSDLLRKDYKQWELETTTSKIRMGISAAPVSFQEWSSRDPHLENEFKSFCEKHNLNLLFVMTMYHAPDFHRELAVFVPFDKEFYESIIQQLSKFDLNPKIIHLKEQVYSDGCLISFYETSIQYSRKKLSPIFSDFIKTL